LPAIFAHRPAQATQLVPGGGCIGADAGTDLDLALQEFRAH